MVRSDFCLNGMNLWPQLVPTVQAGGCGIIGSWHNLGLLILIIQHMNATVNLSSVVDHVHHFLVTNGYVLHDNASCHKTKVISNSF